MPIRDGLLGTVGNTPLIRIASLSEATGCTILGKAEHLNPGGSVKDRAARQIALDAEAAGRLGGKATHEIVEGTAGNTGIGLALVARARGYACHIVMPDNQSPEKIELLRTLGAVLHLVPPKPFADPANYYHVARRLAEERGSFWADQFENPSNARAHELTTGPELVADAGPVDGFVTSAGTGGTVAGISRHLAAVQPKAQSFVIDCEGSSLYSHVTRGTLDADGSSILEGIGIRRITANFGSAKLAGAFLGKDREAVEMCHWLLAHDGLFLGGSAGLGCVGAVKLARQLGPGHTVVTILCDGGSRYASRLYDAGWLAAKGLTPAATSLDFVE
ncbi:MAG TPA: cysteine synthase A [Kofleriaceae bacterium]|nr:cysteine synthase A [Kofleriaceae bacterium]